MCNNLKSGRQSNLSTLLMWLWGVSWNEWADRLAGTADITTGLQRSKAEVLRCLGRLWSVDRPEQYNIDHLKEKGGETENGVHSFIHGRESTCSVRPALELF